ncbi:hypothetical protein CBL_02116 [Carabus blaptoides fortunei]
MESSPSQGSKQGDSREIPVQNDIWFVKETDQYQDYLEDVAEETERIRSGYYLNIRDSLDTCMRYCDYMENPFFKVHMGAVQYMHHRKKQVHKHFDDESSSEHSTSFIESSSESSVHIDAPGLLNKAMRESIVNQSYGRRKRLNSDAMSGVGLLSPSSSANTPIKNLEHMDIVSNELSCMEPDEVSRQINTATPVNETVTNGKLLCYETLGSSSPDVNSTASTTESQQEISAATALCYMNNRCANKFQTPDSTESSSDAEDVYEYNDCRAPSKYQITCHNFMKPV